MRTGRPRKTKNQKNNPPTHEPSQFDIIGFRIAKQLANGHWGIAEDTFRWGLALAKAAHAGEVVLDGPECTEDDE